MENVSETAAGEKNFYELLWDICLKAKHLVEKLEEYKIALGKAETEFLELKNSFAPLMQEKYFLMQTADRYYKAHKYESALDTYLKLGEIDDEEILLRIGEIYSQKGDYENAAKIYDRLIALNEENPVPWFKKANLFVAQTSLEDSVFYLERALELNPNYIEALLLMAKVWLERAEKKKDEFIRKRMLSEAFKCLETAEKENQNSASLIKEFNMAVISAIRSKLEPDKGEEHRQNCFDMLAKIIDGESEDKADVIEKIKHEKILMELGVVVEEPASSSVELDQMEVPASQYQEESYSEEYYVEAKAVEVAEPAVEEEKPSIHETPEPTPSVIFGHFGGDYYIEAPTPSEIFGKPGQPIPEEEELPDFGKKEPSPADLIKEGKEEIRKRKEQVNFSPDKTRMLSPKDMLES